MTRETPCDWGECPYNAMYSEDCRYYCGLGVDEDGPYEEDEPTEEDLDWAQRQWNLEAESMNGDDSYPDEDEEVT